MKRWKVEEPLEDLLEERKEMRKERRRAAENIHAAGKILMEIRRGAEVKERKESGAELKEGKVKISQDLLEGKSPEEAIKELEKEWKERYEELLERERKR